MGVTLVLESLGKRDDNSISGNGWRARIIKEDMESTFRGFLLPTTILEVEGDEERVNSLIKELRLRLLKAGG